MLSMQAVQPIQVLLQIIVQQYLNESYCLNVVTENKLEANMITRPMTSIGVNDNTEKLAERILVVSEIGCSDYIVKMSQPELFMSAYMEAKKLSNARRSDKKIVFILDEENANSVQKILSIEEMAYIPNILFIIPNNISDKCIFYDLVTHKFVGDVEPNDPLYLDRWNSCTQEFEVNYNLFPDKINDLYGKPLRVGCVTYPPYIILDIDLSVTPKGYDGTELRILDEFCRWINCTVKLIRDDDRWGQMFENGTGIGVIGNTALGQADIGIGSMYAWYDIYPYVDFSASCMRSSITAVTPSPRILVSWHLPLLAFSWEMWVTLFFTFVYASIALYIAQGFSADNVIMTTFSIMVTQSQNDSGANWRVRSIMGWLMVTSLVLDNAYGGGLAAIFTVPRYEKSIDTVQDLVDSNMTWGGTTDAWVWSITSSQEPNIIQVVNQFRCYDSEFLKEKSFTRTMGYAVEKLNSGYFAIQDYFTKEAIVDLQVMLDDIYYGYTVIIARKSSPFTDKLSSLIGRLQESGLMLVWETQVALKYLNYWIQLELKTSRIRDVEIVPLSLQHVVGIFIVYGIGVAVSTFLFIVEIFITHRQTKSNT